MDIFGDRRESGKLSRRTVLRAGLVTAGVIAGVAAPLAAQAASLQSPWWYCNSCNGLYWSGKQPYEKEAGVCPESVSLKGGFYYHNSGTPTGPTYNYIMTYNAGSGPNPQPNWFYCANCFGLFYGDAGTREGGWCPYNPYGSQPHNGNGSFPYNLYYDSPNNGQPGWYWCRNCCGLFYSSQPWDPPNSPKDGICPYYTSYPPFQPNDGTKSFNSYNVAH